MAEAAGDDAVLDQENAGHLRRIRRRTADAVAKKYALGERPPEHFCAKQLRGAAASQAECLVETPRRIGDSVDRFEAAPDEQTIQNGAVSHIDEDDANAPSMERGERGLQVGNGFPAKRTAAMAQEDEKNGAGHAAIEETLATMGERLFERRCDGDGGGRLRS